MKKTNNTKLIEAAAQYKHYKEDEKNAKDNKAAAQKILIDKMDELGVDTLTVGEYVVTRNRSTRNILNQKLLKEERPDIAQAYTEAQEVIKFNVNQ